jgi:rsbT co-antagonist protein RsbR
MSDRDAVADPETHVRELIDLFTKNKQQLCSEWANAMHRAGVVAPRDMDKLVDDCAAVFDEYVNFIRTQAGEDFTSLFETLRDRLERSWVELSDEAKVTAKVGQRQLHDILSRAIVKEVGSHDLPHALALLDQYQRRAHAVAVEGVQFALRDRELVIQQQREAIRSLSTPVLQVRERLLICPLIGVIDQERARQLIEHLLHRVRENRARGVVIDITGVPMMDQQTANTLIQAVAACRLVGAFVIVCGISPEIAKTLVQVGAYLQTMETTGDLQSAIEEAEARLGSARTGQPPLDDETDNEAGDSGGYSPT